MADQLEDLCKTFPTCDICENFELLPESPRCPHRSPLHFPVDLYCFTADTLQISSDILVKGSHCLTDPHATVGISQSSMKSKLIQDCMWNGSNSDSSWDFKDLATNTLNADDLYQTPCSAPSPVEYVQQYVSSDFVDPSMIFPHLINLSHQELCGSHTLSDSKEKIDEVTFEKPHMGLPQVTDKAPPKRIKPKAVKSQSAVLTHNELEKIRRHDLNTRFRLLKEEVPELKGKKPASKLTVLLKAREYVCRLTQEQSCLLVELTKQQKRKQKLRNYLELHGCMQH